MKIQVNKKPYKKIALCLTLFFLILWGALGTGASLAWFTDTSPEINNIFHFAEFDLKVSYRTPDTQWEELDGQKKMFDENALYEPGYTQVVYLKVENTGSVPFRFHTAVNVTGYTPAYNALGYRFNLQDYLKFGLLVAETETDMENAVSDREKARQLATTALNNYETDTADLEAGGTVFIALVVRMPEEVGNAANYRGDTVPKVELGVIVKADQIRQ